MHWYRQAIQVKPDWTAAQIKASVRQYRVDPRYTKAHKEYKRHIKNCEVYRRRRDMLDAIALAQTDKQIDEIDSKLAARRKDE